jgi:guanylate kinase
MLNSHVPKKGRLFVVSGPSGVGKSTIIERFLKEDRRAKFSVSYTTRAPRGDEVDGREYHFVTTEVFRRMIEEGRFFEWESVHGHLYGTAKKDVWETLKNGVDILLDIDVKGALAVRKQCEAACLIFIEPPSKEELVRRLEERGEKEIEIRMKRVAEELERKYLFEFTVINDKLETAYRDFSNTIDMARRKMNGPDHC